MMRRLTRWGGGYVLMGPEKKTRLNDEEVNKVGRRLCADGAREEDAPQ